MSRAKQRKVGPDGLTKQQRYVARHKAMIYAKNAKWLREKRALGNKNRTKDTSLNTKTKSQSEEQPAELDPLHSSESIPDANVRRCRCLENYTLSVEFDRQLDVDLAALDKLDQEIAAIDTARRLQEEHKIIRADAERVFTALIPDKWDFQSGWQSEHPFPSSKADHQISDYIQRAGRLLNDLKAVLRKLPQEEDIWEEIFDLHTWTAGLWSFMFQFHDCLTAANKSSDATSESELSGEEDDEDKEN